MRAASPDLLLRALAPWLNRLLLKLTYYSTNSVISGPDSTRVMKLVNSDTGIYTSFKFITL
jgi:hypothetical protein